MDKRIEIDSFNPYENIFPNRKLIDKDKLKLIKVLRQNGFEVIVKPDNDTPLQYLFKKGLREILADPLFAYAINTTSAVVATIFTNYIQKLLEGKSNQNVINIYNNVMITDNSKSKTINLNGKIISAGELKDLGQKRKALKESYAKSMSLSSPYLTLPTPVYLEHTPKLVGWAKLNLNDETLEIEDCKIVDKNVHRKIEQGKIKGASITGIAEKSNCSICNQDYVHCNHISGDTYDGIMCTNSVIKATPIELSLVKSPINPQCIVQLKGK